MTIKFRAVLIDAKEKETPLTWRLTQNEAVEDGKAQATVAWRLDRRYFI